MAAAVVVASSCGGESSNTYLPPRPATVGVTMREYAFAHPPRIPPGRVVVRAHNAGAERHELVVVALPEDLPPIAEQLRSESSRGVPTIAILPERAPATVGSFALSLTPGRYAMVCFLKGADGTAHAFKGMSSEFRVL